MPPAPVKGSAGSLVTYSCTKHTVSHVMKLDPKKLLELKCLNDVLRDPRSRDGGTTLTERSSSPGSEYTLLDYPIDYRGSISSNLFTAEGDGRVIFSLKIENNKASTDSIHDFSVYLHVDNRTSASIYLYWKATLELYGSFSGKPHNEPYALRIGPSATAVSIPCVLYLTREEAHRGFRIDLTYVIEGGWSTDKLEPPSLHESKPFNVEFLLENPVASDITLKGKNKEWKLHKCVLAARSKVFAAMFTSDMKEKSADSLEVKDVDSNAWDALIKYIYTNRIEDLYDVGLEVIYLSDFYDLPDLKNACEAKLISELTIENCLSTFINAGKWSNNLKEAAKLMICSKLSKICVTDEWKEFAKKENDIALEFISQSLSTL